jgi:hypothetical protein
MALVIEIASKKDILTQSLPSHSSVALLRTCEAQANQATIEAAGTGNTSDHTHSLYHRALSAYNQSTISTFPTTVVRNTFVAHIDHVSQQKHLHAAAAVPSCSDLEGAQKTWRI